MAENFDVHVFQLGARRHYAVASALASLGSLGGLYTDFYVSAEFQRMLKTIPVIRQSRLSKKGASRFHEDIDSSLVRQSVFLGLEYLIRRRNAKNSTEANSIKQWAAQRLANLVDVGDLDEKSVIYAYNGAALPVFHRTPGHLHVLDQTIAPMKIETELLNQQYERFPSWGSISHTQSGTPSIADAELEEWALSDLIVCGSEFVAEGLRASGVASQKISVIPSFFEFDGSCPLKAYESKKSERLHLLFVGRSAVRKGLPQLLEAVSKSTFAVALRVVGVSARELPPGFIVPNNVSFFPDVPRSQMRDFYEWADVFCLPSVCEGSAMATYEAAAHGVPTICSKQSGSVLEDGKSALICDPFDVSDIRSCIETLHVDVDLRSKLARSAFSRVQMFHQERYASSLYTAISSLAA